MGSGIGLIICALLCGCIEGTKIVCLGLGGSWSESDNCLRQQIFYYFAVDVGQAEMAALEFVGEAR